MYGGVLLWWQKCSVTGLSDTVAISYNSSHAATAVEHLNVASVTEETEFNFNELKCECSHVASTVVLEGTVLM